MEYRFPSGTPYMGPAYSYDHVSMTQDEMIARRLVPPGQVLDTLWWQRKEIAHRLLQLALDADRHGRAR